MSEHSQQPAKPSRMVMRVRALKRLVLWHGFSKRIPLYLVTEFPKSGGTWFSRMLAECLEVPFPDPHANPEFKTCVMRGMHLHSRRFHNIVAVFRDGRDVMVSAYHHFLFENDANLPYAVQEKRKYLNFKDFDDVATNLPRFIEYMHNEFRQRSRSMRFTWAEFVDSWLEQDAPQVKYEDLLAIPHEAMQRVVHELTGEELDAARLDRIVDKYSFEKMTGRKRGEEKKNTFVRKGIAGDWKNFFNAEARQIFDSYAGQQLIDLGYEANRDWVGRKIGEPPNTVETNEELAKP